MSDEINAHVRALCEAFSAAQSPLHWKLNHWKGFSTVHLPVPGDGSWIGHRIDVDLATIAMHALAEAAKLNCHVYVDRLVSCMPVGTVQVQCWEDYITAQEHEFDLLDPNGLPAAIIAGVVSRLKAEANRKAPSP